MKTLKLTKSEIEAIKEARERCSKNYHDLMNDVVYKTAYNKAKSEFLKEVNGDKIYPKDIFPEISKGQLMDINIMLEKEFGFPLDRLSAHIGRLLLNNIRKSKLEEK